MLTFWTIASFLKDNLKWIIIGVMAVVIAGFVWSWGSRGEEIAELKAAVAKQKQIVKVLEANADIAELNQDLQKSATDALDKRLSERNQELEKLCKLWVKTDDEKDTDPVDTVLDGIDPDRVQ